MSHRSVCSNPPGLVSGSGIESCSWISSWAWMLCAGHSMQSQTCLLNAAPQPPPGSSRRPACMAGNGPCPHSPCRCACTGWPASYTTGGFLEAQATRPPAMPHHISCPCEAFQMKGIIHVQQRQGIRYAFLLMPMLLIGALQCGEAQNFISYNDLLIHASLPPHLVEYIK